MSGTKRPSSDNHESAGTGGGGGRVLLGAKHSAMLDELFEGTDEEDEEDLDQEDQAASVSSPPKKSKLEESATDQKHVHFQAEPAAIIGESKGITDSSEEYSSSDEDEYDLGADGGAQIVAPTDPMDSDDDSALWAEVMGKTSELLSPAERAQLEAKHRQFLQRRAAARQVDGQEAIEQEDDEDAVVDGGDQEQDRVEAAAAADSI